MLKKPITYTDYNGLERTENFYFNLTKAELMEMEITTEGGFIEMIERIANAKNGPEIMRVFKRLIRKAYGIKSDDGKRFIKSEEISDSFEQTEAYSNLFMELLTEEGAAAKFFNALVPQEAK